MRPPSREHFRSRLRRITRPIAQAGFAFWEEEDARRLEALAGLLVARVTLRAALFKEVDAVAVKPREHLGKPHFQDYMHLVNGRVAEARCRYREADEALCAEQRKLIASFGLKPRRFVAEMGEAYERFEKSAHFWKYAETSKIKVTLA